MDYAGNDRRPSVSKIRHAAPLSMSAPRHRGYAICVLLGPSELKRPLSAVQLSPQLGTPSRVRCALRARVNCKG